MISFLIGGLATEFATDRFSEKLPANRADVRPEGRPNCW
jgi:hypothetical protein